MVVGWQDGSDWYIKVSLLQDKKGYELYTKTKAEKRREKSYGRDSKRKEERQQDI